MGAIKDKFIESDSGTRLPVPDPTELTTRALLREVGSLRELMETRLAEYDKAIVLLQRFADRQPTTGELDLKLVALRELHEERFKRLDTQISERDSQREVSAKDVKEAVGQAFAAAKEAVGEQNKSNAMAITKSETSTQKQIDQIGINIEVLSRSVNDKINDVKDRLAGNDLLIRSNTSSSAGRQEGIGSVGAIAIGIIAFISMLASVAAIVITRH